MKSLTDILDALEAELALERELGLRLVEFDRSLLKAPSPAVSSPTLPPAVPRAGELKVATARKPPASAADAHIVAPQTSATRVLLAFVHHRPLPSAGREMVLKILSALGLGSSEAPLVEDPAMPLPQANVYVILGALALRQRFPAKAASPNQWLSGDKGERMLVTYSPEYFLRFADANAVKRMKRDMWTAIQGALRRARS